MEFDNKGLITVSLTPKQADETLSALSLRITDLETWMRDTPDDTDTPHDIKAMEEAEVAILRAGKGQLGWKTETLPEDKT